MEFAHERRRNFRFEISVRIEAPPLAEGYFMAEDVSAGGFKLIVPKEPDPETKYELSFQVGDMVFERYEALVVWSQKNHDEPPSWSVGFLVKMSESERERLAETIKNIAKVELEM